MPGERKHEYRMTSRWTGNSGSGTSGYAAYSRAHECLGPGKLAPIPGSSDPAFRGDPTRYNPEELLVDGRRRTLPALVDRQQLPGGGRWRRRVGPG